MYIALAPNPAVTSPKFLSVITLKERKTMEREQCHII